MILLGLAAAVLVALGWLLGIIHLALDVIPPLPIDVYDEAAMVGSYVGQANSVLPIDFMWICVAVSLTSSVLAMSVRLLRKAVSLFTGGGGGA